jgi:ATP-binding cassette subfamily B protein
MRIPLRRYLSLLATYLKPQWLQVLLMSLCLLAGIGLQLFNPLLLKYFIDTALTGSFSLSLALVGLLFIGLTLLSQGVSIATSYLSENVAWTATNRLRTDLVAHCLALDMSFHRARTPGELIERIDGDVDALSNFFSQFVINLLGSAMLVIAMLVVFFFISWLVGVVMTIFALLALLMLMYLSHRSIPFWKAMRQKSADFFGFLSERLVGTEDVRANGATAYVMRRFLGYVRDWYPVYTKANMAGFIMGSSALFLFVCGTALALALGTYLWSLELASVGTVYLLFRYTDNLSNPISQIQEQLQDLQQAEACIQRIEELLSFTSIISDGSGAPLSEGALSVAFQHVTFGYVADEPVLHDLSFALQPGKVLGLLGRTGSGKTTLARLLFRMYDPQSGEICFGGVSAKETSLRDLRRHIGLVTQDVQLFYASVRDNLTFFNRAISDERILAVLEDIGLMNWFRSLPEGLDTEMEAQGAGLSAGEAQLLAFARVFLTDPGLIILDEASSRLDPATEHLVERAIDKLFSNRTAIVIAHRLKTVQRADEILILEDGHIREYGARQTLANDSSSRFAELLKIGLEEVMA